MVKTIEQAGKGSYQCEECGLHYEDREWAKRCELWCKEHHSCNIGIIKYADENKKGRS